MSLKYSLFISFLFSSTLSAQSLHLAVMGGGGEPRKPTTIFDEPLRAVGNFSKTSPSIRTTVAFNGGHSVTEQIVIDGFGSNIPFSSQNYNAVIANYEKQLKSGEIKSGDKLLVYINTHGAEKSSTEKTHKIATSGSMVTNFDSLGGSSSVSVDNLKKLVNLASEKGVKLGIVDLSCHSGNSLALANANTCVISATGPNHYAGAGSLSFGTLFSKELKKGRTLEEVYLAARSRFTDSSFPMISSPQGQEVQDRLYDPMTPYLYYYNPYSDKFTPYMEKISCPENCKLDDGFKSLMDEAQSVMSLTKDASVRQSVVAFQAAIKEYYEFMTEIHKKMSTMGLNELNNRYQFCSGKNCVDYTLKQLLSMNIDATIAFYEGQGGKENFAYADILRQGKSKRDELLISNPNLRQAENFWSSLPSLQSRTSILQGNVSKTQHKLYLELYKQPIQTGPNPCRDFVL